MHPEEKLKSHITVDVHWRAMCKLWICLDCPQHCPTLKLQEMKTYIGGAIPTGPSWRLISIRLEQGTFQCGAAGVIVHAAKRELKLKWFVHLVLPRLQFRTSLQEEKDGQTHLRRSLSNQDCLYMSYCTCCNCYFYVPRAHVSIRLLIPALCGGDTKARCPGGKSQKWYCIWCSSSICKRKLRCTGIYIYIILYIYMFAWDQNYVVMLIKCIHIKDITNHHYRFQIWTHTGFILQQSQNIKKLLHLDKHPATVQNPMIPEKGTANSGMEEVSLVMGKNGLTTCKHGPTGKLQKLSQGWFDKRVHSQNMAQHGNTKIDSTILEKKTVFSNYSPWVAPTYWGV